MSQFLSLLAVAGVMFVALGSWAIPEWVAMWWVRQQKLPRRYDPFDNSPEMQAIGREENAVWNAYFDSGKQIGIVIMLIVDAILIWFFFNVWYV